MTNAELKIEEDLLAYLTSEILGLGFRDYRTPCRGWKYTFTFGNDHFICAIGYVYPKKPGIYKYLWYSDNEAWYLNGKPIPLECVLENCSNDLRDVILFNINLFINERSLPRCIINI